MRLRSVLKFLPYIVLRWVILHTDESSTGVLTPRGGEAATGKYYEIDIGEAIFCSDKENLLKYKAKLERLTQKTQAKLDALQEESKDLTRCGV